MFEVFFKWIDGIILFLPQEIIKSNPEWSSFLYTICETGVKIGGISFQKLFSSTLWCVKSISNALAKR